MQFDQSPGEGCSQCSTEQQSRPVEHLQHGPPQPLVPGLQLKGVIPLQKQDLTLSLPRVIKFKFPLHPHQKYTHHTVWRTWLFIAYADWKTNHAYFLSLGVKGKPRLSALIIFTATVNHTVSQTQGTSSPGFDKNKNFSPLGIIHLGRVFQSPIRLIQD